MNDIVKVTKAGILRICTANFFVFLLDDEEENSKFKIKVLIRGHTNHH